MGPLGPMVSKLYAYSDETPLISLKISTIAVTFSEVKLIWLMYVGQVFNRYIYTHDENHPNPKMTLVPLSKVSNVKTFYDFGDLENKVKVKIVTCSQVVSK